jgi:tetratricopeptide (TPR) repeat protein
MKNWKSVILFVFSLLILAGLLLAQPQPRVISTPSSDSLIRERWEEREKYIREGYERELKAYIDKEKGDIEALTKRVSDIQWQVGLFAIVLTFLGSLGGFFGFRTIKREMVRAAVDDTRKEYEPKFKELLDKLDLEILLRQAYQVYDDKKYDEAIMLYEKVLKTDPVNSDAWFYLGYSYEKVGKRDKAIEAWRKSIELKPDNAEAHYNLGVTLGVKGETEEEIKEYREAIRLKPDFAEAHARLGATLGLKGEKEEAIREYREAIRHKPDFAEAHNVLGVALGQKGETEEAIREYREAIRLKPDLADAYNNLGITLGKKGETVAAIKEFREAIRLKPDYVGAHNNLGVALGKKGETDEAIKEYREAIRLKPDYAGAHYNLACSYALQGMKEDALKSLEQAVDKGFDDWPLMEKDEELNSLRDDPRFKALAEKVKARWEEKQKKEGKGK